MKTLNQILATLPTSNSLKNESYTIIRHKNITPDLTASLEVLEDSKWQNDIETLAKVADLLEVAFKKAMHFTIIRQNLDFTISDRFVNSFQNVKLNLATPQSISEAFAKMHLFLVVTKHSKTNKLAIVLKRKTALIVMEK